MRKRLSLGLILGGVCLAAAASAQPKPALPQPGSDAFCAAMMEHADQIWPLDEVRACTPWRKKKQAELNKAVADCRTAHPDYLETVGPCDDAGDAATIFWQKSEYVENNRDIPPDQANPVLSRPDKGS